MSFEHPGQAPRPTLRHILPRHWRRKPDPFVATGDQPPLRDIAHAEESKRAGDGWVALRGLLLLLAAAALLTWALTGLLG